MQKLFLNSFPKIQNWADLWINSLKIYTACSYCLPYWGISKYIETKLRTTCFDLIWAFLKNNSLPHFLHDFCRKIFFCYILLPDHISLSSWFTSWDIGQYVYCDCLLTRLWCHECLKLTLSFYTYLFIRKPLFCLSLNFLNVMLEIRLKFSSYFS